MEENDYEVDIVHKLRIITYEVHQRLHTHPMMKVLLSKNLTQRQYLKVLEAFYGFYKSAEKRFGYLENIYALKSRVEWLQQDLKYQGHSLSDIDALRLCCELPEINSELTYLGYCYVVEGSTLGAQIIHKHLKDHLNLTEDRGARFFYAHGSTTNKHWKLFISQLNKPKFIKKEINVLLKSALDTFLSLERWLWQCHMRSE